MNDIRQALVSAGIGELRATRLEHAALAYLNGCKLRDGVSKSTFYRMRRDLLLVGIDIAADLNISALRFSIETIQLKPTEMPEWYLKAS
jgi:II/X family phage/plasmid replication protein